MKIAEIILESTYKTELDIEKAVALLNERCTVSRQILKRPIWRGMRGFEQVMFVEPAKGHRVSANTQNYYTELLDNLPAWQNFPKRSKSIICTTNTGRSYASSYGDLYAIFPVDGAKIAMCPSLDIWRVMTHNALEGRNKKIEDIVSSYPTSTINFVTLNDMYAELGMPENYSDFIATADRYFYDGAERIAEMYDPKSLKFGLHTIDQYANSFASMYDPSELWISDPVVAISKYTWTRFLQAAKGSSGEN